jgi:hypothetical protein
MQSEMNKQMLNNLMQYNSINIILLQEVVKEGFNFMIGSAAHINRGTQKWGT